MITDESSVLIGQHFVYISIFSLESDLDHRGSVYLGKLKVFKHFYGGIKLVSVYSELEKTLKANLFIVHKKNNIHTLILND